MCLIFSGVLKIKDISVLAIKKMFLSQHVILTAIRESKSTDSVGSNSVTVLVSDCFPPVSRSLLLFL